MLWVGECSAASASDFHDIDFHHGDGDGDGDDLESRKIAKRARGVTMKKWREE
jgi:hypothetical protein